MKNSMEGKKEEYKKMEKIVNEAFDSVSRAVKENPKATLNQILAYLTPPKDKDK